ncbi:hypothetical protein IWW42_002197 [Coemansia sp. RSA 1085]|nr:hypothetical protein IWW42_002197 [Coemansia sp. RSA 1085]
MVALSVSHVITDAAGVVILLQQWSSLALQLPKDNSDASKNLQPNFPVDFDHMKFWRNLKQYPSAAHPFAQYVNKQEIGSVDEVNATLANFYKNGSIGKGELETYMLCVSASNIARISAQFNSFDKRPLHGVQILYALIWQRFLAAVIQNNPVDLNEPAHLNFLHNIRSLVSSPYYVGNGVSTACIVSTIDKVISMQTIDLAYKIKMHLNSLTPGAVVHLAESVIDPKNMFMQKAVCISSKAASILSLSNASKMPFYDIDFGLGRPETVLCSTLPTENMLSWLPSEDGGVVINAGIRKDLYLRLKQDKILNEFIDFAN